MTTLCVPPLDGEAWPTLGPAICDFIEDHLVYGPGDLKGEPYKVEPEFRAQIYRMYEVFPRDHPRAGRRRFKRCGLSMRKGTAKSEKAALLAICESHPEAPVRFDGFRLVDGVYLPVGRGVRDPYIPMVAYTQEQAEDIAYGAVYAILENCDLGNEYDLGLDRIKYVAGGKDGGTIKALAGSPNARDGARTTFQHFDETHRLNLPGLVKAHTTMLANMNKRVAADPWSLETTTTFEPGDGSVAEVTHQYAEEVAAGKVKSPNLFYFHRQAKDNAPLETPEEVRAALVEASGPAASWSADIDALIDEWFAPGCDRTYFRRVWLNQVIAGSDKGFDVDLFRSLGVENGPPPPKGTQIVLGFDGARFRDSTALWGCTEQGYLFRLGLWERPSTAKTWEVDAVAVEEAVSSAFEQYDVVRFYCDPPYWDTNVDGWIAKYGNERVVPWWTNRYKIMAYAIKSFVSAISAGSLSHDGDADLIRHVGNAHRQYLGHMDDDGKKMWVICKERPDSIKKIDAAMAALLAWEARGDAIAAGLFKKKKYRARSWA